MAPTLPFRPERRRPVVLLIEDNSMHRDLYGMVIEEELSLLTATRGETGFDLAHAERPDVIVCDAVLPDGDGLKLCQRLRSHPDTASIPVVILTGDDDAYARASNNPSAFASVLMKPCPADYLLTALRKALKARHAAMAGTHFQNPSKHE